MDAGPVSSQTSEPKITLTATSWIFDLHPRLWQSDRSFMANHPADCDCGECSLAARVFADKQQAQILQLLDKLARARRIAVSMQRAVDAASDEIYRLVEPDIGPDRRRRPLPAPADRASRQRIALRALDRLCGKTPGARSELARALELSPRYLCTVSRGKAQPSAALTLLLTMLADDVHPLETIRALWTPPTAPTKRRRR